MLGSMASIPLPDEEISGAKPPLFLDPAHELLYRNYGIEVPIFPFPAPPDGVSGSPPKFTTPKSSTSGWCGRLRRTITRDAKTARCHTPPRAGK